MQLNWIGLLVVLIGALAVAIFYSTWTWRIALAERREEALALAAENPGENPAENPRRVYAWGRGKVLNRRPQRVLNGSDKTTRTMWPSALSLAISSLLKSMDQ